LIKIIIVVALEKIGSKSFNFPTIGDIVACICLTDELTVLTGPSNLSIPFFISSNESAKLVSIDDGKPTPGGTAVGRGIFLISKTSPFNGGITLLIFSANNDKVSTGFKRVFKFPCSWFFVFIVLLSTFSISSKVALTSFFIGSGISETSWRFSGVNKLLLIINELIKERKWLWKKH